MQVQDAAPVREQQLVLVPEQVQHEELELELELELEQVQQQPVQQPLELRSHHHNPLRR